MIVNESLEFQKIGFQIEKTKDESPTLRLEDGSDWGGEWMHHSGGAFSETALIYGQCLEYGFSKNANPVIFSLGLGLGYVEILACALAMKHHSSFFQIYSFEKVDGLRELFLKFLVDEFKSETYQWILESTAKNLDLPWQELKKFMNESISQNRLQLLGDFVSESQKINSFDVTCYDAFSKKTSPELWDENWMTDFFKKGSEKSCVGTYASNGSLKRALKAAGFDVEILEGFQGKRNRTWAYRPDVR